MPVIMHNTVILAFYCKSFVSVLGVAIFLLGTIKEKSWSVMLVRGYILNDQVRAKRCENCKSISEVLTTNYNNPNLLLYGCKDSKCKHRLMRLDFNGELS